MGACRNAGITICTLEQRSKIILESRGIFFACMCQAYGWQTRPPAAPVSPYQYSRRCFGYTVIELKSRGTSRRNGRYQRYYRPTIPRRLLSSALHDVVVESYFFRVFSGFSDFSRHVLPAAVRQRSIERNRRCSVSGFTESQKNKKRTKTEKEKNSS